MRRHSYCIHCHIYHVRCSNDLPIVIDTEIVAQNKPVAVVYYGVCRILECVTIVTVRVTSI
jgi:hypothetical protein